MEGGEIIGTSRIERFVLRSQSAKERQLQLAHPFDDALGYLVSAVGIEMSIVLEISRLTRIAACGIVNKGVLALFLAHRLIERASHSVQVYQGYLLAPCQPSHGLGGNAASGRYVQTPQ